jgi:CRP-like cAMP-binding protein
MSHLNNSILAALSHAVFMGLKPHLRVVNLLSGQVLADSEQRVSSVYFPHTGILSCVVQTEKGWGIQTGMIGRDGVFGASQAMDHRISVNKVMVQVPGSASVADPGAVRQLAASSPEFRELVVRYDQYLLAQAQQAAACNALHDVERRTCAWLLRMHDLAGPELPLTQEFLAQMLGVTRSTITVVAQELQKSGMISYHRGKLRILDIDLIRRHACECPHTVQAHYRLMFGDVGQRVMGDPVGTAPRR